MAPPTNPIIEVLPARKLAVRYGIPARPARAGELVPLDVKSGAVVTGITAPGAFRLAVTEIGCN